MSTPVSVISRYPASTSASTCSRTTSGSWLRLPPRAAGTMQKAQRCWHPSWILTKARERPDRRASGATGTPRDVRTSPTRISGVPALAEIAEQVDQPILLLVAHDQVHARNPRHGLRVGLRIAARDHEERVGIVPRDAADRLAIREIGAPGDRAGIDHVHLRALIRRGGPEAAPLEQRQDLLRLHLVEAAPERGDGDGPGCRHAGTASRSWPQAAPMSSPLLHRTVAMMPCSRR